MTARRSGLFRFVALLFGFAFLYLPIVLLVVYSFNASRLVTVLGGWSTRWYAALIDNDKYRDAALTSLEIAVAGVNRRLDQVDERLARLERRAGLLEAE